MFVARSLPVVFGTPARLTTAARLKTTSSTVIARCTIRFVSRMVLRNVSACQFPPGSVPEHISLAAGLNLPMNGGQTQSPCSVSGNPGKSGRGWLNGGWPDN